ncbi:hypothetical protein CI610_03473 [invertebrate metagenome]|uniref:Uncharacterized protein n=1 Tax=invertebrate metagenome TaxID=1711999 RepID=A0A2H9T327_9ZZZZ
MAAGGRYRLPTEEELAKLLQEKDSKNTKRVINGAVDSFRHFLSATGRPRPKDCENFDVHTLKVRLGEFYAGSRKTMGYLLKTFLKNC